MTKNPIKFIYHLFLYICYRNEKQHEYCLYLMAQDEGMFCEGWNVHTGIAKFNPNKPPQEKPKIIGFKEAMKNLNKDKA